MGVVLVTSVKVAPGRFEDYLKESALKAKPLIEKYGGKNVRLLAAITAGDASGGLSYIVEFDDFATYGTFSDKVLADPEFTALMAIAADGPVSAWGNSVWVDVPLDGAH